MASSSSNSQPLPIGVLVSGTGSNLQVLIDELHPDVVEIVGVASSRADAPALERAAEAGIAGATFDLRYHPDRAARDAGPRGRKRTAACETPGARRPVRTPTR